MTNAAIDADGSSFGPIMRAESPAFDNPTLAGVGDAAPLEPVFPDTAEHPRLVLYQAMDGGLQLRWHLDASLLENAREAFGNGPDIPTPVLRIHRLNGDGSSRIIADAPLNDQDLALRGLANCEADGANGLLRAEIGLSTVAGGWLLVARSNQTLATRPVGASLLRQSETQLLAQVIAVAETLAASRRRQLLMGLHPPALQPAEVVPGTFPLVEPEPGAGTDVMPPITGLTLAMSPVRGDGASGQENGQQEGQGETQTDGQSEGKSDLQSREEKEEPRPNGPVPGSGPMHAHRADADRAIGAELLVHGSAVPGTLLDLGGHPYRVGAGGRFSFRVPLADRALIMGLLAMLSELPVQCRPGDEQAS